MCAVSDFEIFICGGNVGCDYSLADAMVFNTNNMTMSKLADAPFSFHGRNETYIEQDGVVISMVAMPDKGSGLLRFELDFKRFSLVVDGLD